MGWFKPKSTPKHKKQPKKAWRCPVKVNGKVCNKRFKTLEQMLKHTDKKHSGRGGEL